ncbi:hypothetical protein CFU_2709 [Collimonas fungivorans Ter331]|uniref:Uncharacterized protein n=1 Tax=Collimonas fungivorans (strain Ter331) TaxID=1005048 RepID=G0AHD0_COLFT|nr:hypothetical protein CFU_2709 [Collimonas fungivorans Ter331]
MFSFCLETPRRTWTGGFHATASIFDFVLALKEAHC